MRTRAPRMSLFEKIMKFVYAFRVFDYVLCFIVGFGGWIIGRKVRPHCRDFSWDDATIAHAYGGEGTFPSWTLAPIAVLPCLVYILGEFFRIVRTSGAYASAFEVRQNFVMEENPVGSLNDVVCNTLQRRRIQSEETQINREFDAGVSTLDRSEGQIRIWLCVEAVNHWLLAQSFSLALCTCIIDTTKLYAGRLRPDFLARLEREGYTSSSVGVDWCDVAREGRLSFPSGHSGLSFAAFVPLIMYFMGVLKAFRGGSLWRTVVSFIPLILPITVAVSRTRDNRHNFSDIVAGSIIGACCALLSVGLLFRVDEQTGTLVPRQMEFVSKRDIRSAPNENP